MVLVTLLVSFQLTGLRLLFTKLVANWIARISSSLLALDVSVPASAEEATRDDLRIFPPDSVEVVEAVVEVLTSELDDEDRSERRAGLALERVF